MKKNKNKEIIYSAAEELDKAKEYVRMFEKANNFNKERFEDYLKEREEILEDFEILDEDVEETTEILDEEDEKYNTIRYDFTLNTVCFCL